MPQISQFYGIVIRMHWAEHEPPHFHAAYAGHSASIQIASGEVLVGSLPVRARRMIREWVEQHRAELLANWELARAQQPLRTIEPLQ